MFNPKKGLLLLLMFMLPAFTFAEVKTWKLEDCITIALQKNKHYVMAKQDVAIKKAAAASAYAGMLPSVSFNASYTMLDPTTVDNGKISLNPTSDPISTVFTHNWNFGLAAQYAIPFIPYLSDGAWGRAEMGHKLAQRNLQIAKDKLKKAKIGTKAAVSKAFFGLLIAQRVLKLNQANQRQLKAYEKVARRNYYGGRISNYDWLRSKVQLANNKPLVLSAENRVRLAKIGLLQVMAQNLDIKFAVKGALNTAIVTITEKEALKKAFANRADLKELRLTKEILKLQKKLTLNALKPTLAAFANINWDYKTAGMFSSTGRSWVNSWNVGLQLSIPLSEIFPWSKSQKDAKQANMEITKMDHRKQQAEDGIRLEVRQAVLKLNEGIKTINALKESIKLSAQGRQIAVVRYNNGQMSNEQLMDAQLDYQRAQVNLYQAWFSYISAKIDLDKAMGLE